MADNSSFTTEAFHERIQFGSGKLSVLSFIWVYAKDFMLVVFSTV